MSEPRPHLAIELASYRLRARAEGSSLKFGHHYIDKLCPGKEWGDKYGGFKWCTNCEGWFWGNGSTCQPIAEAAFEAEYERVREELTSERLAPQGESKLGGTEEE